MIRRTVPETRTDRRWAARWRQYAAIAVTAVIALLASGCGGSGSSAQPDEETTPTAPEVVEADRTEDTIEDSSGAAEVQESDSDAEAGPEFIELAYWEGIPFETYTQTVEPDEECDASNPDLLICDFESDFYSVGTHIGRARDVATGTITTLLTESCEGPLGTGNPQIQDTRGTITTDRGDELWFHNVSENCTATVFGISYWRVVGGTGRFVDANGLMTGVFPIFESGYVATSVGTLSVRADLWEPSLPPVE